jgi:hypothetical protein
LEGASASLGLTEAQIELARNKYGAEISNAFKVGTARLRARLIELTLDNEDVNALARVLDKRETAQIAGEEPTVIKHVVVPAICQSCGGPAVLPHELPPSRSAPDEARDSVPSTSGNGDDPDSPSLQNTGFYHGSRFHHPSWRR